MEIQERRKKIKEKAKRERKAIYVVFTSIVQDWGTSYGIAILF